MQNQHPSAAFMDYYVKPFIGLYDSLKEATETNVQDRFVFNHDKMRLADFNDVHRNNKSSFIIGEPGYGKSVFLKKLSKCNTDQTKVSSIDCKKLLNNQNYTELTDKLNNFTHMYFDGLDEVPPIQFLEALHLISSIKRSYPSTILYIACRSHYMKRFENDLSAFKGFKIIVIQPFQTSHIREYLKFFLEDEDLIDAIIHKSTAGPARDSVLKAPRYLRALVESVQRGQTSIEELKDISRVQIFEKVIYYKLIQDVEKRFAVLHKQDGSNQGDQSGFKELLKLIQLEKSKLNHNEVFITQRVLEKLALIMEIYQRNRITKQELITVLDEANSNITQIFLQSTSIDLFVERTLKTAEFNYLEFENTEFQEYLAAKELLRLSHTEQVLYDLILEKNLKVIFTNWLDVIQYAIELEPNTIAGSLANYLKQNPSHQVEGRLIDILLGPGACGIDNTLKGEIYTTIFNYYQQSGLYLYQTCFALAELYQDTFNQELVQLLVITDFDANTIRQFTNRVLMVRTLAGKKMLNAKLVSEWIKYLIDCLFVPELKNKFQTFILALEYLSAKDDLIRIYPQIAKQSNEDIGAYLSSLGSLAPDESLDIFIDIVKNHNSANGKESFLNKITSQSAIVKIFDLLIQDPNLIAQLFNQQYHTAYFHDLFTAIRKLNNIEVDKSLEQIFTLMAGQNEYAYYHDTQKEFMERTIEYLVKKDEKFITRLALLPSFPSIIKGLAASFARSITFNQFKEMNTIAESYGWEFEFRHIIGQLRIDGNYERQPLIAQLTEKYPELFVRKEPTQEEIEQREKEETNRLYKEFQKRLMPGQPVYREDLFSFYLGNREKLNPLLKTYEHDYLTARVTEIIDCVVPENYSVQLTREGNVVQFNINNDYWFTFGTYIRMALLYNLNDVLNRNRGKLIKYLPLLSEAMIGEQDLLGKVMDFLGAITEDDEKVMLEFINSRKDDYIFSSAMTFAKFIGSNRLKSFKPTLISLITSDQTALYEKEYAVRSFGEMSEPGQDKVFLNNLFHNFDRDDATRRQLAEIANEYLITVFKDPDAIKWRFNQLKVRDVPILQPESHQQGFRIYSAWEQELDRPIFTRCFDEITEEIVQIEMYDLLAYSLNTRKKAEHVRYSDYLMLIIYEYFIRNNSVKAINKLNSILSYPAFKETSATFKRYMTMLESGLANSVTPYKTISQSIKTYNKTKQHDYIPIYNSVDLSNIFEKALIDLQDFVENKGYYQTALQLSGTSKSKNSAIFNEDILQKTMRVTLENSFLRQGLRNTDIHREVELFDGKRIDLLIKYGFVGPIMAELKLLHNLEIQDKTSRQKYKNKLIQYIKATDAGFSYYIIFKVRNDPGTHQKAFNELVNEYSDIPQLEIRLIDCTR